MHTSRKHTFSFVQITNALSRRVIIGFALFVLAGTIASVSAIKLNASRAARAFATQRYIAPGGVNAGDCSNVGSPCLTLAYAISQSTAMNDTINAAAGTYVLTSTVNVNVANLTISGAGSATTIFQVAQAVGNAFSINAAGVTLTDLQIQKTDVTGVHELILVNASGDSFTLQNSLIQGPDPGSPWSVNGIVSRALVSSTGGVTGLLIQNNTIKHLRQPAYFNPGTVGTVSNNNVSGTRGWVVDGGVINFTGNTWGPPPNQGADIALLASCNPADYPNLGGLSNANSNAFISGQFIGASSGVGTIYVDDSAAPGGDGSQALPFQTIAQGVTAVLPGGIVNVAAGNYLENVSIAKPLSLIGANANTAGSAMRGPESIIRYVGVGSGTESVIGVTAANVTINGFTLDGDDPGFTRAPLTSGDDANAAYGVRPTTVAANNLTVSNNIIKKVEIGIRGDAASQGNVVTQNWFDSIGHYDFGYCVSIRNNFYASVTNNKMTKAWTGVHINNHNGAGGPVSFPITGNEIHSYAGGILYWLQYNQATGATISNNTITAETGAVASNFGILVVSNQDAVNSSFTNNTISGHDYGVGLFNVPTSNNITLGATNSISGSKLAGVLLTDNLNFNPIGLTNFLAGGPGAASTVNLTGLSITGNVNTGVKLEGTTNVQTLNLNGASIGGGVTGLLVTGAPTALTGNTLNNTSFSGQSGDYVTLANSALDNLTINATAVSFDGVTGAAATNAQLVAIENKLTHAVDNTSLGFILVKTGSTVVTETTPGGGLQRAIDLASPGGTVIAGPGTYVEDININKTLIVCGDGPATTTISGPAGGDGATVRISANNVEFKNFKVTREGNTVATWNDPNLNSAGLAIQGLTITGANIHDNQFVQNRTGIDINNSNGHTIRNNVITDNRTGLIFRNQTDNLTVVENEIANNWTVGIVFLDASGGTNVPVQTAANCTFSNNNLSGNWYGQIVDRQSGGSLPAPGTTNLKNFSANWFGTTTPVVTTANSAEPGYAAQIPTTVPGGTATAPGGQPDIAGPASANFDITPLLDVSTDTNVETTLGRGTYGFQGSFNVLNVIATNAQTGATGRIQEGVNLVDTGGTVKALAGSYTENTDVNKAVTLAGTPTINGTLTASVAGAIISPGFGPGAIQHGNLSLVAGSVYSVELASLAGPGTGHDHLDTVGTVSLGGATLSANASFVPPSGSSFTIISNDGSDPVMGIFNGLPEGTVFLVGGTPMQITYAGGINNNDVVLSVNCPVITVTPPTLPNGVAGVPYSQTISAMPMGGGYTFAVTGGTLPTGLTLMGDGTLAGTPMADGSYTFTVTAMGFSPFACTGSQTYTVTIGCPTVSLTPATLPNGTAGVAYSQTIGATPPGGNYTFALTSGTLPAGITLASNGTLSGSSTQTGTFNFRVTGTGFGVCSNFRDYQLTIECTTISVSPASLPGGTVGDAYSQTVSATPAGAYNYSVTSGAMPPGLSLNAATGAITGMPTTTGSFSFTVSATVGACVGSRNYTVTIACSTISFTTSSPLPAGSAGVAYSQMLNVTPAGSYTFSLVAGSLPGGLTLNPGTGLISGTPATTGTSTFTVKAQGANGCSATQTYTLVIACPAITVNPATLPSGTIGTAYSQTVAASPAGGNYTYAVSSGTLPTGLNLNPSTGLLSGTPSANGSFTFTITATGWGGCTGGRSYTVTVGGGGGCPTVTLPASAPNGSVGQLYLKSVAASPVGVYNYTASGSLPPGVTLYNSIGLIFGFPIIPGSYTFTITATAGACSGSQTYTILIGAGFASSLTVFSDFDGDGKSDLSVFRGGVQDAGTWLVANSGDGQLQATPWGSSAAPYNDLAVSGDYDGDGKTDLAVFRRGGGQAGYWYIKRSSDGQVTRQQWGLGTDIPVPGDYDADGKTDIAVWRGSAGAWYILRSSDSGVDGIAWGAASAGDIPVPGDYDGDSKTDVAVFRRGDGHWYIKRSSDGSTVNMEWGVGTDVPVPGDYDGDSKTDLAVWRGSEGNWYIVESSSAALRTITLGSLAEGDAPVTADYDGDGRADAAIWRASTGMWTVKRSSDGGEVSKAHGQSGDIPIVAKRSN